MSTQLRSADSLPSTTSWRNSTRSTTAKGLRFSTSPATSLASRPLIKVNGDDADPLYKFLTEQKGFAGWDMEHPIAHILDNMLSEADPNYKEKPDIKWNFTKFLINKKGQVVARFEPTEKIENIEKQIEELLK